MRGCRAASATVAEVVALIRGLKSEQLDSLLEVSATKRPFTALLRKVRETNPMITLTDKEEEGLRELFAFLAVVEERGFTDERRLCQISLQAWQAMTAGPKRKLMRLGSKQRLPASRQ